MKQTVFRGLFFILAGVFLGACQRSQEPTVAVVGSFKITESDLKTQINDAPTEYRQYAATAEGRRQFLNFIIREKVLLTESKRLGIPKETAYKEAIAKNKEDAKKRLKDYQTTLQVESVLRRLRSTDLAASDSEVEKYYNDHTDEYQKPVELIASHILLSTEAEGQKALAKLKAKQPFEKVAKEMSKDPGTAMRGGKMKPFRRGDIVPEFENAAFALKVGSISGIVKSQFGFHIIKKVSEKALPSLPLAQVKDEIRSKIERDKFDAWVEKQQALLGVHVDEQAVLRLSLEGTKRDEK